MTDNTNEFGRPYDPNNPPTPDAHDAALDRALEDLRSDAPSDGEVQASLDAVWGTLAVEMAPSASATISSCEDYQALMPALVAGTLDEARATLVEDHARSCVPCRRALKAVRAGEPIHARPKAANDNARSPWVALAAVFALAMSAFLVWNLMPGDQGELLQVRGIDGQLFQVADNQLVELRPGDTIDGRQEIRTAAGSGARVELADGSLIEIAERSSLEVERKRRNRGHRIRVGRGSIIVEASEQSRGTLDVATNELLASVKGTIFAVRHGIKGSRVSVIEGEVQVEQGRGSTALYPGDQIGSRATMAALPLSAEIGWSENVDQYLDMLEEFAALREDLNQVLGSSVPRYSSDLLARVPSTTLIYVGLPNPTATVGEVYSMIRERVASSPSLSNWWSQAEAEGPIDQIDEFVDVLRELGSYLGDETVVALGLNADNEPDRPVVLSEVENATGLSAALEAQIADWQQSMPNLPLVLVDDPASLTDGGADSLYVYIGGDAMIASTAVSEIQRFAAGADDGFSATGFHDEIAASYAQGADYLGAVDLGTVFDRVLANETPDPNGDGPDTSEAFQFIGFDQVEYLVVERHQEGDRAHTAAEISFEGPRPGLASWLAAPGPMGALDFFSADATFVAGMVTQDPVDVLDQILAFATEQGDDVGQGMDEFTNETGLDIRNDILATLGGESAFGIDGPALPVPSWKAVVEVYDEVTLQASFETIVARANEEMEEGSASITPTSAGGRIFYEISFTAPEGSAVSGVSSHYTFVDGYMVLAPTRALVEQAIQFRDSGAGVTSSSEFQQLLPTDGWTDFSAVVYNRLGETVSGLIDRLPRPEGMTDEQDQRFSELVSGFTGDGGPSLYCMYGEEQSIRLVSNSPSFLPFSGLQSVLGIGMMMSESGLRDALPDFEELDQLTI